MNKSTRNVIAVAIYLVLSVVFFAIRGWFVAVPTLFAAVATATNSKSGGTMIPLALLASAAGDYAGSTGNFIMQVAFFAVAHIFYICDSCPAERQYVAIWATQQHWPQLLSAIWDLFWRTSSHKQSLSL